MTKIQWTDETWNPIVGCSVLSPGCTNCYAMKMAWRLANNPAAPHYAGTVEKVKGKPVWTGKVAMAPDRVLAKPLRRRKPTMYFVNSMGDLFHEDVPDAWIDKVFAVMALAPQHTFQVLTKRGARMREYIGGALDRMDGVIQPLRTDNNRGVGPVPHLEPGDRWWPLPNVWLGVSVEDQERADERIPLLLETPAAVRWVSAEPLLGPVDLSRMGLWLCQHWRTEDSKPRAPWCPDDPTKWWWEPQALRGSGQRMINWVVAGGESAQNKPGRPMHPDWARSLRDQCQAAGVAFNFKQQGDWVARPSLSAAKVLSAGSNRKYEVMDDGLVMQRVGAKNAGRLLDGRTWDEIPGTGS